MREALVSEAGRSMKAIDVIETLSRLIALRGAPACIRSDNGPEFIAYQVRDFLAAVSVQRCTSSLAVRGKTDMRKVTTVVFAMNF